MCNGCASSISQVLYYSEKLIACCAVVATTFCIITTITVVLALGIGLGYNFCYVDMRTRRRYVPARYNFKGSPRKQGFDPDAVIARRAMNNRSDTYVRPSNFDITTENINITDATLPDLGGHGRFGRFTFTTVNVAVTTRPTIINDYFTLTPKKLIFPTLSTWDTVEEVTPSPALSADIYKTIANLNASLDKLTKWWRTFPSSPPQSQEEENNLTEWRRTFLSRLQQVKRDEDDIAQVPKLKQEDNVKLLSKYLSNLPPQVVEKEDNITKWWKTFPSHLPQITEKEDNLPRWWKTYQPHLVEPRGEENVTSHLLRETERENNKTISQTPQLKEDDVQWWQAFLSRLPQVMEKADSLTKRWETGPPHLPEYKDNIKWWKNFLSHLPRGEEKDTDTWKLISQVSEEGNSTKSSSQVKADKDNSTKWWKSFLLGLPEVEQKDNVTKWWKTVQSHLPRSKVEEEKNEKWLNTFSSDPTQIKEDEDNATKWWKTFLSHLPEVVEEKKNNATKWWKSFLSHLPQIKENEEESTKWWKTFLSHLPGEQEKKQNETKWWKTFLSNVPKIKDENDNGTKWWKSFLSRLPEDLNEEKDHNTTQWWKSFLTHEPQENVKEDNGTKWWKTLFSRLPELIEEQKQNATQWWKSFVSHAPQLKDNKENQTKWWKTFLNRQSGAVKEDNQKTTKWWKTIVQTHEPQLKEEEPNEKKWWKTFTKPLTINEDERDTSTPTSKNKEVIPVFKEDEYNDANAVENKTIWWKSFTARPPQIKNKDSVTKRDKYIPTRLPQAEEEVETEGTKSPIELNKQTTAIQPDSPLRAEYIRFTDKPVENVQNNNQKVAPSRRDEHLNLDGPITIPIKGIDLISLLSKLRADDRNFTIQIVTS